MLALAAYHVVTPPIPVEARRGARTTAGIHAGVIIPLGSGHLRGELELRYEQLINPIESTRFYVPLVLRLHAQHPTSREASTNRYDARGKRFGNPSTPSPRSRIAIE